MSRKKVGQICPKKAFDNRKFSQQLVGLLRTNGVTVKQLAQRLDISTERAKNWYRENNVGMTALDFMKMMYQYEFIRRAVRSSSLKIE